MLLMPPWTARVLLEAVAAMGTICSLAFYFLSALGLASFLRDRRKKLDQPPLPDSQLPAVSILKPLKGVDPAAWESFCSHCEQDYPQFQLIFGISDPCDPAAEVVRKLQTKYPNLSIELIVCERIVGANIKVSNLAQMLPTARHEILLVNDSDIRVPADYLRKVMTPLADPGVGMVTCLYRGIPGHTLGSRLESLGISTDFAAGVLAARFLEGGIRFGLGSTLAFRRADLHAIGGFETLVDYLADDYELGKRIAGLGRRVVLSEVVVDTLLPAYDLKAFFEHQLRWGRAIRASRRWGYFGLVFTFGLPWAVLTVLAAEGAPWAWGLLVTTLLLRLTVALVVGRGVLGDRQLPGLLSLIPLRDAIAVLVWAASFASNTVVWRGESFVLKHGKLIRTDTPS